MAVKKTVHTAEEIKAVLEELNGQTDRGAAIIAASVIEELLAVIIQKRLLPLTSDLRRSLFERTNAPLSSFSAKIDLGLLLGLYSASAAKHLHILRECRNKFAHRIEALTFDHPEITKIMAPLLDEPAFGAMESNRHRYLAVVQLNAMLFVAMGYSDIRIVELGQTRPDIFVELFAWLWPEKAEVFRGLLKEMCRPPGKRDLKAAPYLRARQPR
jgi:hypothetical protein